MAFVKDIRLSVGPRVLGVFRGRLVSGFNDYRPNAPAQPVHKGWDIAAPTGVYARALGSGEVVRVRDRDSVSGYHQEVTVWYASALTYCLYGHVRQGIRLAAGDQFLQGDILAAVGTSYDAMGTTPHFHCQAWKDRDAMLSYSAAGAIDPQRLETWYLDGRR